MIQMILIQNDNLFLVKNKLTKKAAMRNYLPPVRMATINKTGNNKCWRGCGGKGTLIGCWLECKLV